jgi:hypothetical protein
MSGDDVKLVGREEVLTDVENCLCRCFIRFRFLFFFIIFGGLEFFPEPELLDFYRVLFLPSPPSPHPLTRIRNQKPPSAHQCPSPFILYVHRFLFAPRLSFERENLKVG